MIDDDPRGRKRPPPPAPAKFDDAAADRENEYADEKGAAAVPVLAIPKLFRPDAGIKPEN